MHLAYEDSELIDRLRADLRQTGFGRDAVRACLGETADESRLRGNLVPARRALAAAPETVLGLQVSLLLLGEPLPAEAVDTAFPTLGLAGALRLGVLQADASAYRAAVSLNPVSLPHPLLESESLHLWIASDLDDHLRRGAALPDHVMGVGGATRSLVAQAPIGVAAPRTSIRSALDLGTGCGVLALVCRAAGIERIVATDISGRALAFARFNERLNAETAPGGVTARPIEFRLGNLFDAVGDEEFDLILSNPPFVVTPRESPAVVRYEYRDAGLAGDALAEAVISEGPRHLAVDGTMVCLANWEYLWGHSGLERARAWIADRAPEGCTAWIIERDKLNTVQYAETWIRDGRTLPGSSEFDELMNAWLHDFEVRRVVAIGLGSVRVQRDGSPGVHVRAESATGALGARSAPELTRCFETGTRAGAMEPGAVLDTRWVRAPGVREIREHAPGAEHPSAIALHVDTPIARAVNADTLLAATVGVCDGDLNLRQICEALAGILEVDADALEDALIPEVRELAWLGMLVDAEG